MTRVAKGKAGTGRKAKPPSLDEIESAAVAGLRDIAWRLDSSDMAEMYEAASRMSAFPVTRSLLPRAMSAIKADDPIVLKAALGMAGMNAYGSYVNELVTLMKGVNPADREQVLQVIEQRMRQTGGLGSTSEQKRWVDALEGLGREHQPTIFGIMALLGPQGTQWVRTLITERVETLHPGAVQRLTAFAEPTRGALLKSLCQRSAEKKRELLPYICGLIDTRTIQNLMPFLKAGDWHERSVVAETVGKLGIISPVGIVMDIVADADWRVKQAFLKDLNLASSKFAALLKVLGYLVGDSHTRVGGLAERCLLRLGSEPCRGSTIEAQQKRIEKEFRAHLLKAADANKDIQSDWLGVSLVETSLIPVFSEQEEEATRGIERAQGVSLEDIGGPRPGAEPETPKKDSRLDLMAALIGARQAAKAPETPKEQASSSTEHVSPLPVSGSTPTDRFMMLLRSMTAISGKEISISKLKENAVSSGMTEQEFDTTLEQLERDGIVYRSRKGSVSIVDIEV